MNSMLNAGVSTGATTGSGAISQSALAGNLTLDTTALTNALTSNASGVKAMMQSWSIKFSSLVDFRGRARRDDLGPDAGRDLPAAASWPPRSRT